MLIRLECFQLPCRQNPFGWLHTACELLPAGSRRLPCPSPFKLCTKMTCHLCHFFLTREAISHQDKVSPCQQNQDTFTSFLLTLMWSRSDPNAPQQFVHQTPRCWKSGLLASTTFNPISFKILHNHRTRLGNSFCPALRSSLKWRGYMYRDWGATARGCSVFPQQTGLLRTSHLPPH